LYAEIVRLSSRISDKVHILKNEEKCFMRPYVFSGMRYDEPELYMYSQMHKLRAKILERVPGAEEASELTIIYLKNGDIGDIR